MIIKLKTKFLFLFCFSYIFPSYIYADSVFSPQETIRHRYTPDTSDLDDSSDYLQKYKQENKKRMELQKELEAIQNSMSPLKQNNDQELIPKNIKKVTYKDEENKNEVLSTIESQIQNINQNNSTSFSASQPTPPLPKKKKSLFSRMEKPKEQMYIYQRPLVFGVSSSSIALDSSHLSEKKNIIPSGSYVKVKILTGVEASSNAQTPYPMLLQADYAFTGPNRTKVDMRNCFFMAKTTANLSTERVLGALDSISCVKTNGKYEERTARGYLAGEDSTFGVVGDLISKQGQVLAAAVVASLAKGAGEALAAAQVTTNVVAGNAGAPASASNITGDKAAFVLGKSFADSGSIVAEWYLKYAEQLVPAIAVGSGRSIWVILQSPIEIPDLNDESET